MYSCTRTNNKINILYKNDLLTGLVTNMSKLINWTIEEKIAFETWLKISIEMIEKYCTPKETLAKPTHK